MPDLPWKDVVEAGEISARDMAQLLRLLADKIEESDLTGRALNNKKLAWEREQQAALQASKKAHAAALLTPRRMEQIATEFVDRLVNDKQIWPEVLHYVHSVCFEGGAPDRAKLNFRAIDSIQRVTKAGDALLPAQKHKQTLVLDRNTLPKFGDHKALRALIDDKLWDAISDNHDQPPLPSRVPEDPDLLRVYIEGVKFVYQSVHNHLGAQGDSIPGSTIPLYNHLFISAGEAAFGVLYQLDLIASPQKPYIDLSRPPSRFCNAFGNLAVFSAPIEKVEEKVAERTEYAPSLGQVLIALESMSSQFGRGFDLSHAPAFLSKEATQFAHAAQRAGLALIETTSPQDDRGLRAIWLPTCDDAVLALFNQTENGQFSDDKYSDHEKLVSLISAWFPDQLTQLPRSLPWHEYRREILAPLEHRLRHRSRALLSKPLGKTEDISKALATEFGIDAY